MTTTDPAEAVRLAEVAEEKARDALQKAVGATQAARRAQREALAATIAKRERDRKNADARARVKAQKLGALWGIEMDRERDLDSNPFYVSHPAFQDQDDDPHNGDHYVHCWEEVLDRANDYVEALTAKGFTPETARTAKAAA